MRYQTLLPLILLFFAVPLHAVEYHGLYHAEVEVADQGGEARAAGMHQAMAEVLLKVSGTSQVLDDEGLNEAMTSASRYVQQYRYRSEAIPAEEQKPDAEGKIARERLFLSVRFDQKSIDDLVRQYGFTVWGTARPTTLIWLGVEQNGNRVLVGANDSGLVRELINDESGRRALPVKLPLLDLTDQSKVRPVDIWGDFLDTIEQASQRYNPQAILVGRLYSVGGKWEVRWTLVHQGSVVRWQQQAQDVSELIAGGIGHTSELLVQSFALSFASGGGSMLMEVEGIASLKQYRRVLDYLSAVHGITSVLADEVTPNAVRFTLQTDGGRDAVLQTIALGDVIEAAPQPEPIPVPQSVPVPEQPVGAAKQPGEEGEGGDGAPAPVQPKPQVLHYRLVP